MTELLDSWNSQFGRILLLKIMVHWKSVLIIHWKNWCWNWSSNTLVTWWKELTHWKRPWCWKRLMVEGEGDDRGWDRWMASPTWRTWVWVTLGVGDGQGSLAYCSPWGCKESDMTEWLNWTDVCAWNKSHERIDDIYSFYLLMFTVVTSYACKCFCWILWRHIEV